MIENNDSFLSTPPSQRIISLDVLRGIAVLGILIMNIESFSMIMAAYINPTAYGDLTGINKVVWVFNHLIAQAKFMSIFSILFGAGILLFTERMAYKGLKPGAMHYRRNFWLLLLGLSHAYLIWYGDILVTYSLCAFLVYLFRKLKPKTLFILSGLFFIVPVLFYIMFGYSLPYWPEEGYQQNLETWAPSSEIIQQKIESMTGGWLVQMDKRISAAIFMQTFVFIIQVFWRVVSMMLLGMALYKLNILQANKSKSFYKRLTLFGIIPGFFISGLGIYQNFKHEWHMDYSMFFGSQFNYIGSIGVALGYIGIIMLICKSDGFKRFKNVMSSVGKMAFTHYILMSAIATFIFYGHGLGLYGQVERIYQLLIVIGIWAIILVISPLWLKKFRYGPLEWLWRTLTYRKNIPMKKKEAQPDIS
jgi:uncharacterized protein